MIIKYSSAELMAKLVAIEDTLAVVQQAQAAHRQALQSIAQQETDMAKKMSDFAADFETRFNSLTEDVAAQTTVNQSAITLLNGISAQNTAFKAQIQELIDSAGTDADRAKLQAVVDGMDAQNAAMDAQRQELADAVTANTAAEPTPTEPPPA